MPRDIQQIEPRKRALPRPNGAYKLLVALLDGWMPSTIEVGPGGGSRSYLEIRSIRRLSRILGTESKRIRGWLVWLEDQGYIESLTLSESRTSARLRLKRPRNI